MDRIDEALLTRSDYLLSDNLSARSGTVFITGTQALVRLPLMQRALDAQAGLATAGCRSRWTIWKPPVCASTRSARAFRSSAAACSNSCGACARSS